MPYRKQAGPWLEGDEGGKEGLLPTSKVREELPGEMTPWWKMGSLEGTRPVKDRRRAERNSMCKGSEVGKHLKEGIDRAA